MAVEAYIQEEHIGIAVPYTVAEAYIVVAEVHIVVVVERTVVEAYIQVVEQDTVEVYNKGLWFANMNNMKHLKPPKAAASEQDTYFQTLLQVQDFHCQTQTGIL